MSYRVLVFGSRDWADEFAIYCVLNGYLSDEVGVTLINGRGRGADAIAWNWAGLNRAAGVTREPYPAHWKQHGKGAGPIRNQRMVDEGKPEVAWGFVTKPLAESRGSADMAERLKAAGIPCYIVTGERDMTTDKPTTAPMVCAGFPPAPFYGNGWRGMRGCGWRGKAAPDDRCPDCRGDLIPADEKVERS